MSRLRLWVARRRPTGDEGTSLMELMVGMVVMTILMTICTSAIVSMFAGTGKTQGVQNSSLQLNVAFNRLDSQVRYASAIDQPTGSLSTDTLSVTFLTATPASNRCTQLRIRTLAGTTQQQLVERTWTVTVNPDGTVATSAVSGWSQLAAGITAIDQSGASVVPFTVSTPANGTVQQLRLRLIALDSASQAQTKSSSEVVFSALNSVAAVRNHTSSSLCAQTVMS